jgi:hypothetical protein
MREAISGQRSAVSGQRSAVSDQKAGGDEMADSKLDRRIEGGLLMKCTVVIGCLIAMTVGIPALLWAESDPPKAEIVQIGEWKLTETTEVPGEILEIDHQGQLKVQDLMAQLKACADSDCKDAVQKKIESAKQSVYVQELEFQLDIALKNNWEEDIRMLTDALSAIRKETDTVKKDRVIPQRSDEKSRVRPAGIAGE